MVRLMLEALVQPTRPFQIACLRCGIVRASGRTATRQLDSPECPHCGYLGWREHSRSPFKLAFDKRRLLEPPPWDTAV